MYKLGPEGQKVQQRLRQNQKFTVTTNFSSLQTRNIDLLLNSLINSHNLNSFQLISYSVTYFPQVKNEENLKLLVEAFLQNNVIFNVESKNLDSYLVIEAIKSIFDTKLKISEPTLPVTAFFHAIITTIYQSKCENWRKIMVITGILLSRNEFELQKIPETSSYLLKHYNALLELNLELINRVLAHPFNYQLGNLIMISIGCCLPFWSHKQKAALPHQVISDFSVNSLFNIILTEPTEVLAMNLKSDPVLKHLNRLAFVIENSITHVPFNDLIKLLDTILTFSTQLSFNYSDTPQSWELLKTVLFAIVIIFQGVVSRTIQLHNGLSKQQYPIILGKLLKSLYHLNFILEKIGNAGFSAYNFVYSTSISGIFQFGGGEQLGIEFIKNIRPKINSPYETGKTLFTLNFFEHFITHCSEAYYHDIISPFATKLLYSTNQPVLESAHSVILASLSLPRNAVIVSAAAIPYLNILLDQYPTLISSNQLSLAVSTIAKSVFPPSTAYDLNKDNARELLHVLYLKTLNTPEITLQKETYNAKAGVILCLINTLPYIEAKNLENWLCNVWELIQTCSNKQFLTEKLWNIISEDLDIHRANVAINWWYSNDKGASLKSPVNKL